MDEKISARDLERIQLRITSMLGRLSRYGRGMRTVGAVISATSLVSLGFLISGEVGIFILRWDASLQFSLVLSFANLFLAMAHERIRRQGDVLFEILSDDVQRELIRFRELSGDVRTQLYDQINVETRYVLRSYTDSHEMLLVPGRWGVTMYVLFNLLLCGLSVFLLRLRA